MSSNISFISIMLFTTLSMHGMETCESSELRNQIELCNQEHDSNVCFVINLPTELFPSIQSLENNIKFFMKLSSTCEKFNRLLTVEEIGKRCKDYSSNDKNKILLNMLLFIQSKERLPIFILICAGVDVNCEKMSLLKSAVKQGDTQLAQLLFQHNADPNTVIDVSQPDLLMLNAIPVFFLIKTMEMVQIFIAHGCDIHKGDIYGGSVLWYIMDNSYPADLMKFYLTQKVDTKALSNVDKEKPWRRKSLLHRFAETPYSGTFKDISNFLEKAKLLLDTLPEQVNTADKQGLTPLDIIEESLKRFKRRNSRLENKVAKIAFKVLKELFFEYNGMTADLLERLINKELREKNIPLVCEV